MRVLVTGGAGFIGSHVCQALLDQGHEVVCLDNFFTGSKDNVKDLESDTKFSVVEHDIIDPYFDDSQIDQIYNLACPASPVHYQKNPIRTVKANTIGVINMLGLAKKHKARILQASTSEVYGDPKVSPQPETYRGDVNTIGPRACYDEGKRCAETLFFDYHREHGLDIRVARIFNTYGPNMAQNDGRVVSNFIIQALQNKPLKIDGDGSQTRSFCYVEDLVKGLIAMMNSDDLGPMNLGNPEEFTIRALAEKVIVMTDSKSSIDYSGSFREDDPMQRRPDISKAKQILKWEPVVKLEEGLPKTIEYFRNKLKK